MTPACATGCWTVRAVWPFGRVRPFWSPWLALPLKPHAGLIPVRELGPARFEGLLEDRQRRLDRNRLLIFEARYRCRADA